MWTIKNLRGNGVVDLKCTNCNHINRYFSSHFLKAAIKQYKATNQSPIGIKCDNCGSSVPLKNLEKLYFILETI